MVGTEINVIVMYKYSQSILNQWYVGVERTPDLTRTRQVIGAQNLTRDTRPA